MHPIASKCDLLPKTMKKSDLPSNLIVYDGVADPPKLDRDRSLLLLPSQPNAQPLRLDRTVTHRYNNIEGYVQLTLKLQPIAAQQIVVTNQLSENSDRIFFATNEVIEGVYLQLLLGRTSRELGEVTSKPYTGIQVLLLDVQEYFSHPIHVKVATICTLRECLKNSNPISVSSGASHF